jgi:hypothetical protein
MHIHPTMHPVKPAVPRCDASPRARVAVRRGRLDRPFGWRPVYIWRICGVPSARSLATVTRRRTSLSELVASRCQWAVGRCGYGDVDFGWH